MYSLNQYLVWTVRYPISWCCMSLSLLFPGLWTFLSLITDWQNIVHLILVQVLVTSQFFFQDHQLDWLLQGCLRAFISVDLGVWIGLISRISTGALPGNSCHIWPLCDTLQASLNPVHVLRGGAEEEKAEIARLSSFVGAIAIGDLVKSTLGPKGMDKILISVGRSEGETMNSVACCGSLLGGQCVCSFVLDINILVHAKYISELIWTIFFLYSCWIWRHTCWSVSMCHLFHCF